jgi:tetratricopeptide (TPR) repeat protein
MIFWATLLLFCRAAWAGGAAGSAARPSSSPSRPSLRASLEGIPLPDLKRLEPAVAQQIEKMHRDVEGALENTALLKSDLAESYGLLGEVFHAYEYFDAAATCYRNAQRLAPEDYRWPHLLADVEQRRGALEKSREYHQAALKLRPGDPASLVELGNVCLELDRLDEADKNFEEALRRDPSSAAARAGRGQVALIRRQFTEAASDFEAAVRAVPTANRLHYGLAMAYRGLGRLEDARRELRMSGSVGVRPPDALLDALPHLLEGVRVHILRGRLAYENGRYGEAAAEFEQAVAADPKNVPALVDFASALARQGKTSAAIDRYRQALAIAPDNPTARLDLGQLLGGQGRWREAAGDLAVAADALADDGDAQRLYGRALRRLGRNEEALRRFAMAERLNPLDEDAVVEGAELLVDAGRYREARSVLEAGHSRMPGQGRIAYALATLLAACPDATLRDGARALDLATRVYRALPTPRHARTVALALAELGRCGQAAEWEQKAIDTGPENGAQEIAETRERLARYRAGPPCRPPMNSSGPSSQK